MDLYFDLSRGHFVSGPGTNDRVTVLEFKRGDVLPVVVRFCRGATVQSLETGASGKIGFKEQGDFDGDYVAAAPSWTKAGSGTTTTYTFELDLGTEELDDLLGVGAGTDVESVALNFELQFVEGDYTTSSNTITATVLNDVIRGDESGPTDIAGGSPVNQATASRVGIEVDSLPLDGHTLTITDGVTPEVYTFKDTPALATHIQIGADQAATRDNILSTVDSALVTLTAGVSSNLFTATAQESGAAGNSITIGQTGGGITSTGALTGGVDATSGFVGTMQVDASYLYVVSAVTSGVPVWRRIAHASF